ncbi:YIP1 family protein [Rubrobacter taiwanensis]|uniref:YIP1 family protein n=1 Tax=Rubrobacter taiwanensis TaxID=185139 RepID=UPI0014055654|nr:YIP1 family protein [Rubrobacter taiwanensis]
MGRRVAGYRSPEGFREALGGVWLRPRRFFRGLDPEGGPLRPALFAAGVLYVNLVLSALLEAVWAREFNPVLLYAPVVGLVVAAVLGPAFVAGLAALSLMVLNPDNSPTRGFLPTFRAYGFATAIAAVLWVPYAPLVAVPYGLYVATAAMQETHRLSFGRAAAAALIPLGALLLIILLLTGPADAWELLKNPPG